MIMFTTLSNLSGTREKEDYNDFSCLLFILSLVVFQKEYKGITNMIMFTTFSNLSGTREKEV